MLEPRGRSFDVETDDNGNVVAVWFGCVLVRFTQGKVYGNRSADMAKAYRQPGNVRPVDDIVLRPIPGCPSCKSNKRVTAFQGEGASPSAEGWQCDKCYLTFGFTALGRWAYVDQSTTSRNWWQRLWDRIPGAIR